MKQYDKANSFKSNSEMTVKTNYSSGLLKYCPSTKLIRGIPSSVTQQSLSGVLKPHVCKSFMQHVPHKQS